MAMLAVKKSNEHQRSSSNNEGDVAIAWLKAPSIERHDLRDAEQKHTQAGEAEAALLDSERQQKNHYAFNAPRHGDHPRTHFQSEHTSEQDDGDEKLHLFRTAGNHGKRPDPSAQILRDAVAPAETESKEQARQQNGDG